MSLKQYLSVFTKISLNQYCFELEKNKKNIG